MGVQLEVKQQTTTMIRLVGDKLRKETRVANLYIVPPKGEYEFDITGYALPFEIKRDQQYMKEGDSEYQTMTRIEFTITSGKGAGKMFDQMWGLKIGPKSNLGRCCQAMNIPIPKTGNFDLDSIIGYGGKGYVIPGETLGDDGKPRYAKLSLDTVEGTHAPERAYTFEGELDDEPVSSNGHEASSQSQESEDGWPT